jgi:hypothetical protein
MRFLSFVRLLAVVAGWAVFGVVAFFFVGCAVVAVSLGVVGWFFLRLLL